MATIQVWGEGRDALWTPEGPVNVPKTYDYLPAGDGALTRALRGVMGRKRLFVVMRKVNKHYPSRQVGLWAPSTLIAAERERLAALRTEPHKQRLAEQRERKQERDISAFAEAIRLRFPACPDEEALVIATHACEVGSGRVGRSNTAEDPVRAAVVAHVRHEHTDYDALLDSHIEGWMSYEERREARFRVRENVSEGIDDILRQWQQAAEAGTIYDTATSTSALP
jgi:hypothetical protein